MPDDEMMSGLPVNKFVDFVELYRDAAGLWRWRAKSGNGRVVADSGEGYERQADASDAAAATTELDPADFRWVDE